MIRNMLLGSALTTTLALVAAPAMAKPWASPTDPLESGNGAAHAYGYFYNHASQTAHTQAHQRRAGGTTDKVYVETEYLYYKTDPISCGEYVRTCYVRDTSKQTTHTSNYYYERHDTGRTLDPVGTSARGVIKTCQDRPFAPDNCSGSATVSFSY